MYENWKILKSELSEKQEEYTQVANWCNQTQQYRIIDDGEYYKVEKIPEPTIDEKKTQVRQVRNSYLEQYVDNRTKNPFMWDSLTDEEKEELGQYRQYLLNYPESSETWYEQNPLTFEDWKQMI